MQDISNAVLLEEIKKYVDKKIKEVYQYIDKRFEENNAMLLKYIDKKFEERDNKLFNDLVKYIDKRFEERDNKLFNDLVKYIDKRFEERDNKLFNDLVKYIDKRFEESHQQISEEFIDTLQMISKKTKNQFFAQELEKEIAKVEEKLNRKEKEDKESFKSNNARLNKIELSQEYFESKLYDMQNKEKNKVAV